MTQSTSSLLGVSDDFRYRLRDTHVLGTTNSWLILSDLLFDLLSELLPDLRVPVVVLPSIFVLAVLVENLS